MSLFDKKFLFEIFADYATAPKKHQPPPEPKRTWIYGGTRAKVKANTKSEARAKFKTMYGRLPVGVVILEI